MNIQHTCTIHINLSCNCHLAELLLRDQQYDLWTSPGGPSPVVHGLKGWLQSRRSWEESSIWVLIERPYTLTRSHKRSNMVSLSQVTDSPEPLRPSWSPSHFTWAIFMAQQKGMNAILYMATRNYQEYANKANVNTINLNYPHKNTQQLLVTRHHHRRRGYYHPHRQSYIPSSLASFVIMVIYTCKCPNLASSAQTAFLRFLSVDLYKRIDI